MGWPGLVIVPEAPVRVSPQPGEVKTKENWIILFKIDLMSRRGPLTLSLIVLTHAVSSKLHHWFLLMLNQLRQTFHRIVLSGD